MAMRFAAHSGGLSNRVVAGRSRRTTVRVAASTDVPPNVAEARAWIAAWRSKQGRMAPPAEVAAPTPTNGTGKSKKAAKPASAEARAAAPAPPSQPKHKFGPSKSFDDGTLVFTADQLTAVKYKDVKLKK